MKFLSYQHNGTSSWGALVDQGIVDLGAVMGGTLQSAIETQQLDIAKNHAANAGSFIDQADIQYLSPILNPGKIACIGVNYKNRNAEYKDGSADPVFPSLFMRTADSFTVQNEPLWRPPESDQLDYEGEIVIVIGKEGRRISQDDAYDHIAGLTIMNEGTLRDWVRHAKFNVTQGKNFINSGSIGPWMVSSDEFDAQKYENMRITTKVNGELRQNDTTASMMFPFKYIISYCSQFFHLKPGDIIATGTPNGAGARFDPPKYLIPGDVIEVSVDGVGQLVNGVIDEPI